MEYIIFLIAALVSSGMLALFEYLSVSKKKSAVEGQLKFLNSQAELKEQLKVSFGDLYGQMIDLSTIRKKAQEYHSIEESLKAERGRITITQAELETVEGRLRELEEIERELEASSIETREEINILQKKHADLNNKNQTLQGEIEGAHEQIVNVISKIEMSAQMQEQVEMMKAEMLEAHEKIDTLLTQIEQGNEQYFILKKRYDALDIEYAQLYEKFSSLESSQSSASSDE